MFYNYFERITAHFQNIDLFINSFILEIFTKILKQYFSFFNRFFPHFRFTFSLFISPLNTVDMMTIIIINVRKKKMEKWSGHGGGKRRQRDINKKQQF